MKKTIIRKTVLNNRDARIKCNITDENGYISITGEIILKYCRRPAVCGCIHTEIATAFPEIAPYLFLHLVNKDGTVMHEINNSLYCLANNDPERAKMILNCTDGEIDDLYSLVYYGLHKKRTVYCYTDMKNNCRPGYQVTGKDSIKLYSDALEKMDLKNRRLKALQEFYSVVANLDNM